MKFTLTWNDSKGAENSIAEWLKKGRSSDGITLIKAEHCFVADKVTGAVSAGAYLLRCKGSIFSYLGYKRHVKGAKPWIGWGWPK